MGIKELPSSERPYEKLEMYGENFLSNAELLAIIIKTGTKEFTSVEIAQKILSLEKNNKIGTLRFLQELSIEELTKIKGIGKILPATQKITAFQSGIFSSLATISPPRSSTSGNIDTRKTDHSAEICCPTVDMNQLIKLFIHPPEWVLLYHNRHALSTACMPITVLTDPGHFQQKTILQRKSGPVKFVKIIIDRICSRWYYRQAFDEIWACSSGG